MKIRIVIGITLVLVIAAAILLAQINIGKAEIIRFKNGLSINTLKPFYLEIETIMNTIGPEKAKEFNTGLSLILFKNAAVVNDCVIQNTANSPGLLPAFMTKACDLAASLVSQFCNLEAVSNQHKDLCNNTVVTDYLNQRHLSPHEQSQLAWDLFKMGNIYPTNRNNTAAIAALH